MEESNSHQADSENPSDESREGIISTMLNLPKIQDTLDTFNEWEKNMWANEDIQSQARRDAERRSHSA